MNKLLQFSSMNSKLLYGLPYRSKLLTDFPLVACSRACVSEAGQNGNFREIYNFPMIKYFAAVSGLKKFALATTVIGFPIVGMLEHLQTTPTNIVIAYVYVGCTVTLLLSFLSSYMNRTIGFIYVSDDLKKLKIASLDFWAKRKETVISQDDWIPLSDLPSSLLSIPELMPYVTARTYTSKDTFKFYYKYGEITEENIMKKLTGL